jgi:hypothetical protein
MRTLFFWVVIANVALLMWEYKTGAFAPANLGTEHLAETRQEPIRLLSELKAVQVAPAPAVPTPVVAITVTDASDQLALKAPLLPIADNTASVAEKKIVAATQAIAPAPPTFSTATTPSGTTPPTQCYEAGPFATIKAYRAWTHHLIGTGSEIKAISHDEKIASKYMVYYPAAATEPESKANIALLKSQGIKDLWPLSGADKGSISLGLFGKEESALVMKSELLAKGINAEIKILYKTKPQQYAWIKGALLLTGRLQELQKTDPQVPIKPVKDEAQGCQ